MSDTQSKTPFQQDIERTMLEERIRSYVTEDAVRLTSVEGPAYTHIPPTVEVYSRFRDDIEREVARRLRSAQQS